MTPIQKLVFTFAVIISYSSVLGQNVTRTTATTPVSTQSQVAKWNRITSEQLGVEARDPVGHKIGPNAAKRTGLGMNWYPVDIYKQTLVGKLHHFNFYDGWGDEADWNFFIVPTARFQFILRDVLPIADRDDVHDCDTRDDCCEGEITPDESFYDNPYFNKNSGSSPLEGQDIGMYGPWVYEEAHGNRPEIHPSEMIWWKENDNDRSNYFLLLLQDDSNRFDRLDNYSGTIIHPWSKVPRRGEFKIAFEVNLPPPEVANVFVKRYFVRELHSLNVVTENDAAARADADNGKDHALEYNGRVVLTIQEMQTKDDNIGVRFEEITRNASNRRLQGYIVISSKIGVNDRGREGLHLIKLSQSTSGPVIALVSRDSTKPITARQLAGTVTFSQGNKLLYDVGLFTNQPDDTISISGLSMTTSSGRVQPNFTKSNVVALGRTKQLGTIKDINVFQKGTLEIATSKGTLSLQLPEVGLAPKIEEIKQVDTITDSSAFQNFIRFASNSNAPIPAQNELGAKLKKSKVITAIVKPAYAVKRNGKVSLEDGNPITEELNKAFDNTGLQPSNIAASQLQTDVRWNFEAKNLMTGRPVTVSNFPSDTTISVEVAKAQQGATLLKVTFPDEPTGVIYEFKAIGEMTDAFGNKGTIVKTLWSHAISDNNEQALVRSILTTSARLANIEPSKILLDQNFESMVHGQEDENDPEIRRARSSNLFVLNSIRNDGIIDAKEMSQIVSLINQMKE